MSERVALVIGNGAYANAGSLKNPGNDARDIEARLSRFGFATTLLLNANMIEMDRGLRTFKKRLKAADVGLVFFAGHGLQIDDENYLIAVDTDVSDESAAKHSSLSLNRVIETMERSCTTTNVIILDACRDNPFRQLWARSLARRGLAPVYVPKGTLIAYATSPGQVASDGTGNNGQYTAALLKHIDAVDNSIESMLKRVRNTLAAATCGKQTSWEHTSLAGEFYFNRSVGLKINRYVEAALKDKLFVPIAAKKAHQVIQSLKIHDWYVQNPAISGFEASHIERASKNSLFVVGRNVYQAACGNAWAAISFINNFPPLAVKLTTEKWRAILDGMLFEIFFDSSGELRSLPKAELLETLFSLQEYPALADSFDFIADCLTQFRSRSTLFPVEIGQFLSI